MRLKELNSIFVGDEDWLFQGHKWNLQQLQEKNFEMLQEHRISEVQDDPSFSNLHLISP